MTFDITSLDVSKHSELGYEVNIVNPKDDTNTGVVIKVMGIFAPRFKELLRQARKRDEARKAAKNAASADERDADVADMLADVTFGWTGLVENGVEVKFSREEAKRIYLKYQVIRDQVFESAMNVGNFIVG